MRCKTEWALDVSASQPLLVIYLPDEQIILYTSFRGIHRLKISQEQTSYKKF